MDKNWKEVASILPKQPCDDLREEVMMAVYDEDAIGENLILYNRESVEVADRIDRTMTPEDWERHEKSRRSHWGARCTCSHCGEDFYAGYMKNGIILRGGEDGQIYDGWVSKDEENTLILEDGEGVCCPICWNLGIVTPRRKLRRGRTSRMMQAEVVNTGGYTAVMYWMVTRYQDDTGLDNTQFEPHQALVIDRAGKLRRFRANRQGREVTDIQWEPCTRSCDPMQQPYYSYDADAISGRKVGGWVLAYGPDLDGHTGEKTALDKYIGAGGTWPGAYLHIWQRWPQVENLMRHGFSEAVRQEIDDQLDRAVYHYELRDAPPILWVDWRECKPHRMLGMSKEAFRVIRDAQWSAETAKVWTKWRTVTGNTDALAYELCRKKVGERDVEKLLDMIQRGWSGFDPVRVVKYLEKKEMLRGGVQHLIDYRVMLRDAQLAETEETLWPRDLVAAHDRVVEMLGHKKGLTGTGNFAVTRVKLEGLEWTDGELCIVIPKTEQELKDEGRILRHCVGTYGEKHCSGRPIFFVRHYRRPERSYYTLNIDLTGTEPRQIQLHGYGNERHGEHKQYTHTIPKKVLEFCDRWEREVLRPWWDMRLQADDNKIKPASKRKKRKKENSAA